MDGWINKTPFSGTFSHEPPNTAEEYVTIFRLMDDHNIPVSVNLIITSDITTEHPFFNPECVEIMRQVRRAIKEEQKPE